MSQLPTNEGSRQPGGRPGFEERAKALQLVCRTFLEYLGHRAVDTAIVAEDAPYDIPRDGSELLVIHHLSQPAFVKSYMVYSEPGMPLLEGKYHSLEEFIRNFYRDQIERSAGSSASTIPGFPAPPGSTLWEDVIERFVEALEEESQQMEEDITTWLASPELQRLGRIIWA